MSAPVTKQHLKIIDEIRVGDRCMRFDITDAHAAQLIADSEARAVAELRGVFPKILQALGNGACCTPDVSIEFIKAIPNEVAEVVAQLRAEVNAQCLLNAKGSEREAVLLGRVDRMAKECLNLRADLDAIKAIRNEETARAESAEREVERLKRDYDYDHKCLHEVRERCELWKQRAERAEAELHALRLVCGTTDANKFSTWVDRANAKADKAEAELAGIRALANRRNKGDHSQDATHQLVVALDQALDIAQAELADEAIALRDMMSERDAAEAALTKERERLDWLAESWDNPLAINLHPSYGWSAASKNIRAAIDAAMKEGA